MLRKKSKTVLFTLADILKFFAIRLHIQAAQYSHERGTSRDPFPGLYRTKIRDFFGRPEKFLSEENYSKLLTSFWIPPSMAKGALTSRMNEIVRGGQIRALDEKMFKWRGASPCIKMVKSKPTPVGHWTSQVCVRLASSGLPVCVGMFPFTRCTALGETVQLSDVVAWAVEQQGNDVKSCYVMDSFYLDNTSHPVLLEKNVPFIASIKNDRFKPLTERLKEKVTDQGKWYGAYLPRKNEVMVHHFSKDSNVGRKTVLSNAFKLARSRRQPEYRPPAWLEYKLSFSVCDEFNRALADTTYPFRRSSWESNFDDLFTSTIFINIANIWKSLDFDARADKTLPYCFNSAAINLFAYAVGLEE